MRVPTASDDAAAAALCGRWVRPPDGQPARRGADPYHAAALTPEERGIGFGPVAMPALDRRQVLVEHSFQYLGVPGSNFWHSPFKGREEATPCLGLTVHPSQRTFSSTTP